MQKRAFKENYPHYAETQMRQLEEQSKLDDDDDDDDEDEEDEDEDDMLDGTHEDDMDVRSFLDAKIGAQWRGTERGQG